jgi:DNA-binding beta-propeller fold protein YncE
MTSLLRTLAVSIVLLQTTPALADWERQVIDAGGKPGQELAISSETSRAYVPLLGDRALAVLDGNGSQVARLELEIKPTSAGYSAATGRVFVLGMFDNAVMAIDEASGAQSRIAVGAYPDNIVVDDARGKVFVSMWGGLSGAGGLAVIDASTLDTRNVAVGGAVTTIALDQATGNVFLTGEVGGRSFVMAVDTAGNVLGREDAGYRAYSLAVDSRNGRVYVGALSGNPSDPGVSRVFTIYSQPGLQRVSRVEWPTGPDRSQLVFLVDPAEPGLYLSSNGSTNILRLNADGQDLRVWTLPLGDTVLSDGRRITNGVFGLNANPATGHIFASSPVGSLVAEFDPSNGTSEVIGLPGAVGFNAVLFWPGGDRLIVPDAAGDQQLTILHRTSAAD